MANYRNLEVWQLSRVLTKNIYGLTTAFPRSEVFGLSAQLRRAAVSIMCNIAEGQGRWSARDQCNFYIVARGSLLEIESELFIAADVEYITAEKLEEHLNQTEKIGRKLTGLIRSTRDR
ncbi:MAG TPA: four helix bundle protein [Thermoanaerobaculia bacterium]